jgi:hypothetical protein
VIVISSIEKGGAEDVVRRGAAISATLREGNNIGLKHRLNALAGVFDKLGLIWSYGL